MLVLARREKSPLTGEGDLVQHGKGHSRFARMSVCRSDPTGEVVDRGLDGTYRHAIVDQLIDLLHHFFINPNLTAGRTHHGRDMLEQVNVVAALLLVGDGGCLHLATTDRTESIVCVGCHDFLLRLRHGSSHLRGSSQWTVMT
jgi:hypothetical protein